MPLDLELRRSGITSTEVAAVLGVDEQRDAHAVWAVKIGGLLPEPPTWRMQLGHYLEHAVIGIYADHYSKKPVERLFDKTFRHPKYPHVLATPDALVGDDTGVDAKTANWDQRHQWGETADDIPDRVQLQMLTCMEVMDRDHWDVALLSGDQFRVFTLHRDREFGEFVMNELERIWEEHFTTKDNPPPIGGSKASSKWLKQTYPQHRKADVRVATDEEIEELRRYGRLKSVQKDLAKERDRLENQFKAAIAEREGLVWPTGRLTWKRANDATHTNWEALAWTLMTQHVRLPDGSSKDEEACKALISDHSSKRPGVRRIYFSSDECFSDAEEAASDAA